MDENIFFKRTSAGIPVIADPIKNADTAVFMVAVGTGSRDETKEIGGLSHLLEHVVFRATKTKDSFQMSKEIEGAGGETNAFTGKELTAYYAATIKETSKVAKDMVSDITINPLIREADVDLEKKIVLQEISMRDSDPESYLHKIFEEAAWKGHELSNDEAGESDIVSKFTSEDLRKYFDERYRIPNIAVIASGAVTGDEVLEWTESTFDSVGNGMMIKRDPAGKRNSGFTFKANKGDHSYAGMGFRTYPASHEDAASLTVLNAILGSGMSSRLFQSIREEKALVYSVYSSIDQHSDGGVMGTFMSSTKANMMESIETAVDCYRKLRDEGLIEGEMERAKNLIKGANARQMESTVNRAYRLTRRFMLTGNPESASERIKAIEAVTQEDVMRVASDVMTSDNLTLAIYSAKTKEIERIRMDQFDL